MTTDNGIARCLDIRDGNEIWHERIDGQYSASPMYADGKIYFFSEDGNATVIAAGRKFELLARNNLTDGSPAIPELQGPSSGFMGTPAIAGNSFFLRTRTSLYRIEN